MIHHESLASIFFNPAPIMGLVEIVKTPLTAAHLVKLAEELVADIEKTSITIDDAPSEYGFVANRCYNALRREAERIVEEGIATEEQVNTALVRDSTIPEDRSNE